MNATIQRSSLLSRFDQDAGPWRPMFYPIEILVPITASESESGSITINNQPFIWQTLGHQIIGNTGDPEASGLYQDGQYDLEFKDEQSNYQSAPVAASAAFGGGAFGFIIPFPFPIPYQGSKTITFRITNRVTRALTPPDDYFRVKLVMIGVADWGALTA